MLFVLSIFGLLLTYVITSIYNVGMELILVSPIVHYCCLRHNPVSYPFRLSPYKVNGNPLTTVPLKKVEAPKPLNNQEDLWKLVHQIDSICLNKSYFDSFSCYDSYYSHFYNYGKESYRNDKSLFRNLINNDPIVVSEYCESIGFHSLISRFSTVSQPLSDSSNKELLR